ncbi:MAG TPA: flagellar basal body rod protein FlgB [Bacillota bacterium]|nr:flagellar basal body rod protein FlgB [Bacillota bacterium]
MLYKALQSPYVRSLERALDFAAMRSELLSQNIANVNTPNYKRSDVDFAAIFQETVAQNQIPLARTNGRHLMNTPTELGKPRIVTEQDSIGRNDGNNVDVEYEMAQITENSMYYQSLTSLWKREMSKLKMVIQGRG